MPNDVQKARAAAKKAGYILRKSRSTLNPNNLGGFMLVCPDGNYVVAGARFDLDAQDVMEFCAQALQ